MDATVVTIFAYPVNMALGLLQKRDANDPQRSVCKTVSPDQTSPEKLVTKKSVSNCPFRV